jgi:hypothetical protein
MDNKYNILITVSSPDIALINAKKYLGNDTKLFISTHKNKKYMLLNPETNKMIHFGDIRYMDYIFTKDDDKKTNYLNRATNIRGNWRDSKYSPNNLAINILWS